MKPNAQHHILGAIRNPDIRKSLLDLLSHVTRSKTAGWHRQIETEILSIFEKWKQEHGSRSPTTLRGVRGLGMPRNLSFAKARPYECGHELGATDYVSLFFVLLRTDYEPLNPLLDKEGIPELLAVAAAIEPEMTTLDSLVTALQTFLIASERESDRQSRINDHILHVVRTELLPAKQKEDAKVTNLAAGRAKGNDKKSAKAQERKLEIREKAIAYFKSKATKRDGAHVIDITDGKCAEELAKASRYAKSTILKKISGCKDEAISQLNSENA